MKYSRGFKYSKCCLSLLANIRREETKNTEEDSSDNNENNNDKISLHLPGSGSLIASVIVEKNYRKFVKFKLKLELVSRAVHENQIGRSKNTENVHGNVKSFSYKQLPGSEKRLKIMQFNLPPSQQRLQHVKQG
jgi:hypothetical protein